MLKWHNVIDLHKATSLSIEKSQGISVSNSYLSPPKIMRWSQTLSRSHTAIRSELITNGASFTVGTNQLEFASSWPGYLYERCRFDQVIDLSYPGRANIEIYDSTMEYLQTLQSHADIMIIIMWNGAADDVEKDYNHVINMVDVLNSLHVPYAFTFSINYFYPPILPRRDAKKNFYKNIKDSLIQTMMSCNYFPSKKEHYLYDFAFFHDMLDDCQYHPNIQCRLKWTDEILLPELTKLGLVTEFTG